MLLCLKRLLQMANLSSRTQAHNSIARLDISVQEQTFRETQAARVVLRGVR